jgi:hypothetical protein
MDAAPLREFGTETLPCEHCGMPKISPPADNIQEFRLDNDFQTTFKSWKTGVEGDGRYGLEITHEEVIHQGTGLLIFWRLVPRPHAARR